MVSILGLIVILMGLGFHYAIQGLSGVQDLKAANTEVQQ